MSSSGNVPYFIRFMLDPEIYSPPVDPPDSVKLVQTHISYVVLAGDFVYKFKKPMDFGFLDFATLARRHHFCEQELVLNRRLCPSIYLGLVNISGRRDALVLHDPAALDAPAVLEYGVKMRRMPEERMMTNVIKAGKLTRQMVDRIVDILKPFYEKAAVGPEIEKFGAARAVGANVLDNLKQCETYIGCESLSREEYDRIGGYVERFLENEALFGQRIDAGRIRDCHGDLHSANICLADEVYIYDCIEFNHRFRYSDVASDLAFLAMDLDYYGLEELSDYFIERFRRESQDPDLTEVLNFYKCYRAAVRGKIGLLTAHEHEVDDQTREQAIAQATRYFVLAQRYAEAG